MEPGVEYVLDVVSAGVTDYALVGRRNSYFAPSNVYLMPLVHQGESMALSRANEVLVGQTHGQMAFSADAGRLAIGSRRGVSLWDTSDALHPRQTDKLDVAAEDLALLGESLYVVSRDGLTGYDLSAAAPTATSHFPGDYRAIELAGKVGLLTAAVPCPADHGLYMTCGDHVLAVDLGPGATAKWLWSGAADHGTVTAAVTDGSKVYVGSSSGLFVYDLGGDGQEPISSYSQSAGDGSTVWGILDLELNDTELLVLSGFGEERKVSSLAIGSTGPTPLSFFEALPVAAQDARYGIGEADKGGSINWGSQTSTTQNAYNWPPVKGVTTRPVYSGADVVGSWVFGSTADTVSEGSTFFPGFIGKVSNGAMVPMSDGMDLFWVGHGQADEPIDNSILTAQYTDPITGHTYNRNQHSLSGPGDPHLHDRNNDGYLDCYDNYGFDPLNPTVTCDGVQQNTGADGMYVDNVTAFDSFVQGNLNKAWAIGGEYAFSWNYPIDPYMYALYLKKMSDRIRTNGGGSNAKVYLKDVAHLAGSVWCASTPCYNISREPGHDAADALDIADWWYTVATHFYNLGGSLNGFLTDAGISNYDDRYCWDALDGSLEGFTWCDDQNNLGAYVVPYDGSAPDYVETQNGQWLERRVRPFLLDQDDQFRGGYSWNSFTRFIDGEVKYVFFWLVDGTHHSTTVAQRFGMTNPTLDTAQPWGAGGSSLYNVTSHPTGERCPFNPWQRYAAFSGYFYARDDGTAGVPAADQSAGYIACNYRPNYSGWKIQAGYGRTFDLVVSEGVGAPTRNYKEDADGNGQVDADPTLMTAMIPHDEPNGSGGIQEGREDGLMMGALMHQLAMKWGSAFGFDGYSVSHWYSRAAHQMPDVFDGILGDDEFNLYTCAAPELPLLDRDGGGAVTPVGEVFKRIAAQSTPNYTWWPEGTRWSPSSSATNITLMEQTFDGDLGEGWTPVNDGAGATWHFKNNCTPSSLTGHTTTGAARWGLSTNCGDYGAGAPATTDTLTSPSVRVAACAGALTLSLNYFMDFGEPQPWDRGDIDISVDGGNFVTVASSGPASGQVDLNEFPSSDRTSWSAVSIDLSNYLPATTVAVRFKGVTQDGINNLDDGFYVDDVRISCNPNYVYQQTFSSSLGDTTATNDGTGPTWHFKNNCTPSSQSGHTTTGAARWGTGADCNNYGNQPSGSSTDFLATPDLNVRACSTSLWLEYNYFLDFEEDANFDIASVEKSVNGGAFTEVATSAGAGVMNEFSGSGVARPWWSRAAIDLSSSLPADTVKIRFKGFTLDGISNTDDGFYIDDIRVSCLPTTCYNGETYKQRPDQSHDRDGNGNNVDAGDLPSGW